MLENVSDSTPTYRFPIFNVVCLNLRWCIVCNVWEFSFVCCACAWYTGWSDQVWTNVYLNSSINMQEKMKIFYRDYN